MCRSYFIFFLSLLFVSCTPARAQTQWDHNGSVMALHASGAARQFTYIAPRAGIPATAGTLLFTGKKVGDSYSGTAYTLSARCGNMGFNVSGPVSSDQRNVTLYGSVPIRDGACRVVGHRDEVLAFNFIDPSAKNGLSLTLNGTTNGFHIPQVYQGRTILVQWPDNEHTIFAVEDLIAAVGAKNDILVGRTQGINNAYAVIDGVGPNARRMIVFDEEWFNTVAQRGAYYRVILAHEVGHHICKHTLGEFFGAPWNKELEADRAAGAILRKVHDAGGGVGGGTVELAEIVATVRATLWGPGSATHPPGDQRLRAYVDGWNEGSPCLAAAYVPVNPAPDRELSAADRIVARYGNDQVWSFQNSVLKHSYFRSEISGDSIRLVFDRPGPLAARAGVARGQVIFEGIAEGQKIRGTFKDYAPGCPTIDYPIEGNFVENNGIFLVGSPPKRANCQAAGFYAPTLHAFKNTSDWGFEAPRN